MQNKTQNRNSKVVSGVKMWTRVIFDQEIINISSEVVI